MAKKPAAKGKAGKAVSAASKRRKQAKILGYILAPAVALVAYPTVLVALGGMLPTLVAYIVDNRRQRYAAKTVGYMNGAGVFYVASKMWVADHSLDHALMLLYDPLNWLIMLGAASIGWGLYFVLPPMANAYLTVTHDMRIKQLEKEQEMLIEEWGEDVARDAPPLDEPLEEEKAGPDEAANRQAERAQAAR